MSPKHPDLGAAAGKPPWAVRARVHPLVQFALQGLQELFAVDDVVRKSDAEGMFSGHVVQQRRPGHTCEEIRAESRQVSV